MEAISDKEAIDAFRRFNRFYTREIGALDEWLLGSPFPLTEARVLFELASRSAGSEPIHAAQLGAELRLDTGYLSRIIGRFEKAGLVTRAKAAGDARRRPLRLEERGRELFRDLDARAREGASRRLSSLGPMRLASLVDSMRTVERILGGSAGRPSFSLREPLPGDLGWVVSAHAETYAREYGWGSDFEALVARIVADFAARRDPSRERAWIAEAEGERVGSVFIVRIDDETAKLRLLLVAPEARGYGLGRRLVEECLAFARSAGYRRMTLWTNGSLEAARAIYAKVGFVLAASEPETTFAPGTLSETWEISL